MKILHYSLGFPPNRTGGLISYTIALMDEQIRQGDTVFYLYPGSINPFRKHPYIKPDKQHKKMNFQAFSLVNSLPLALFGGIRRPGDFMKPCSKGLYLNFLKQLNPDIIHVHSLMGIHKEFFEAARTLGIKLVFTSHDYFGIAPEPNFYYDEKNYDDNNTVHQWATIGSTALETWKLRIFQFKFYPIIRQVAHKIRPQKIKLVSRMKQKSIYQTALPDEQCFLELKNYYLAIFSKIDFFIFNSTLAYEVYQNNIELKDNFLCIPVTNSQIRVNHAPIRLLSRPVKVGYIGPYEEYKGFFDFIKLANLLKNDDYSFHVFGSDVNVDLPHNVVNHGHFNRNELDSVYDGLDVVIVPSLWKETFGLVTMEALSHKIRVIVRDTVGSKDLIEKEFIFHDIVELCDILPKINEYSVVSFKKVITMKQHRSEIESVYQRLAQSGRVE